MYMGVFLACTSSCLWLLSLNEQALDFQWHQDSAQVCKEAQPPVDFATHASAWLLLNIRLKPFIYSASLFLAPERMIHFHRGQQWYSHLRQRGMAGAGKSCPCGSSKHARSLSNERSVPCSLGAARVQGLLFSFDWPNRLQSVTSLWLDKCSI